MKIIYLFYLTSIFFYQDSRIDDIRKEYSQIQSELGSYDYKETDHDWSSERGTITGYFKKGELKKIVLISYGSIGQERSEFFYNNDGNLFFVFSNQEVYDMSGVLEPNYKAGQVTVKESFENRYYFGSQSLFRWIEPNGNVVDDKVALSQQGLKLLNLSKRLCEEIENL